jgi:hypothetical protein
MPLIPTIGMRRLRFSDRHLTGAFQSCAVPASPVALVRIADFLKSGKAGITEL